MESLSSGVLLRLLRDMEASSASDEDSSSPAGPAVLQVTSIIPALAGTGLFPDRGFYLRVSDASHSTYVSLPQDHDDLIFSDSLQLGQLIRVSSLDPASPVPLLRGFHLLPSRLPCPTGTTNLVAASQFSNSDPTPTFFPPPPLPERKKRSPVGPRAWSDAPLRSKSIPTSPVKGKRRGIERGSSDILSELAKISVTVVDEDSEDSDGSRASCASSPSCILSAKTMRKNWNSGGIMKERRRDTRPVGRSRSASVSPNKFSCDTSAEIIITKKDAEKTLKVHGGATKRNGCVSNSPENSYTRNPFSSCNEIKWPENNVLWSSLPPLLVKFGKDVLRQRDLALNAAADALQEAFASEKLIQSLSIYSELKSNVEGDPQQFVERFLNFHQDLAEARLVTYSLAKLSSTSSGSASVKTAARVARERKKHAVLWIKAALESDFSRIPTPENTINSSIDSPTDAKFISPDIFCNRPRCSCLISKERKSSEILPKVTDLADALLSECNRWFLKYIEKFLDAIQSESYQTGCGSQIASLLNMLKKVDDWLDSVSSKEKVWVSDRFKDGLEDDEAEACGRVRKKIYGLLLRHVETAASALESRDAAKEEKEGVNLVQEEELSDD